MRMIVSSVLIMAESMLLAERFHSFKNFTPHYRAPKKTVLTPKQKQERCKAKRAKQARKINYKHQQLSAFQLKRKLKAKLSTKNQKQ